MGVPFLLPGDLPKPGIKPRSPALQADSLPSGPLGKPNIMFKFTAVFLKICNWPYWILYVKMWMPCSLSFLDIRSISLGDTALITTTGIDNYPDAFPSVQLFLSMGIHQPLWLLPHSSLPSFPLEHSSNPLTLSHTQSMHRNVVWFGLFYGFVFLFFPILP